MGPVQFLKTFTMLLLVTMNCDCKPVDFILENIDDTGATICPEELAKRRLENANTILFSEPVSLEKENVPLQIADKNNLGKIIPGSTDISNEKTTICPEELQMNKLENTLNKNSQDNPYEDSDSENTNKEDAEYKRNSEETTTICPEELEKEKLKGVQQHLNDISGKKDNSEKHELFEHSDLSQSAETTTICPEELPKRIEKNLLNKLSEKDNLEDNKGFETLINDFASSDTTTNCPEELDKKNEETLNEIFDKADNIQLKTIGIIKHKTNWDTHKETFENFVDEPTTVCPKELARRKLEQSQKYLTKFKELVNKFQQGKTFRKRRQATDYSSYYANQPSYNAQGVAVLSDKNYLNQQQSNYNSKDYNLPSKAALGTNQNQPTYKPQGYNLQSYSPQAVKTYQQLRKPHQTPNTYQKNTNFYPKNYKNNFNNKSVQMYRNPSTYVKYPSNGSLTNYRVNTVGNRRQFQGARPFVSTSARPNIRITRKKKFKPSPVFA